MSSKLTIEQKHEIAHSKSTYKDLAKQFNIDNKVIAKIKKEAGTNIGKGGGKQRNKLTEDQKKYILNSPLSGQDLANELGFTKTTINTLRREAGLSRGQQWNGVVTSAKISDEQRQEIIKSDLTPTELSKIYPLHPAYICRIRTLAGVRSGTGKYARNPNNSNKIEFTEEQLILVRDASISTLKLEKIIGIGHAVIGRKRKEFGICFKEFQKANKPEKKVRVRRPMNKVEKVKKEKVVKVKIKVKKELPKKIIKPKDPKPAFKTRHEVEHEQKAKAVKAKNDYKAIEAKKMAEGYKYITRIGRFGIKETVLIKQ